MQEVWDKKTLINTYVVNYQRLYLKKKAEKNKKKKRRKVEGKERKGITLLSFLIFACFFFFGYFFLQGIPALSFQLKLLTITSD